MITHDQDSAKGCFAGTPNYIAGLTTRQSNLVALVPTEQLLIINCYSFRVYHLLYLLRATALVTTVYDSLS